MADHRYILPEPNARDAMVKELADRFTGIRETSSADSFEVMDTFDWRLFKTGWLMLRSTDAYRTIDIHTGQPIDKLVLQSEKRIVFAWDFTESEMADALEPVMEMRALISLGKVECQCVQHELLNSDEKIVARLVLETYRLDTGENAVEHCRIEPVRGYAKAAKLAVAGLQEMGLEPARQSPVLTLLERNGFSPGTNSSKVDIELQPDIPATEAVRRIMEQLVTVMHQNLSGVREDIDSEFLHDFRVSVRRARSLLGQMKGVLDARTTADLTTRLKNMGDITGNLRDLDVYLLKKAEYTAMVADVLKPGIAQLFSALARKRRYAKARMIKRMATDAFASDMDVLDAFVRSDRPAKSDAPEGNRPIGELARAVIHKRYRRIVKKGRKITAATPDEELHRLRIDCKKLRYLLEFFTSLFPKDQMKILIKQLKQLQENLGDFNDLSVQQEFLVDYLQGIAPKSPREILLAAAVGGLVTRLGIEHQRVRSQFLSVFARFDDAENRNRFKSLFA
ncbi:CHAD domain-containing protein [Desulfosarcina widdelii]|uniref:CHAD domain-containing protein n=1 Tax=Desulfosarcina widdelii TaxID=947919 RepID=A0A5K7ZJC7_9BACT|nr:CHAD domain-containing protein [Desulfosarcina widdelii]BBO78374.1 CHAD domain-containing protein [Desulfosarcina widdelii]